MCDEYRENVSLVQRRGVVSIVLDRRCVMGAEVREKIYIQH